MSLAAHRIASSSLILAIALTVARASVAQNDVTAAEALFREGRRLMEARSYEQACPKLAESHRLDPGTGALLALAMCHEAQGKIATAWGEYNDVASRARREQRPDREQAARAKANALEPQLSKLIVSVARGGDTTPGLEVKRDGAALGVGAWGAPIPIDPGEHVIEATAPGRQPWRSVIVVGKEPAEQNVVVPVLVEGSAGAVVVAQGGGVGDSRSLTRAPEADDVRASRWRTAGIIAGGLGVAGMGIGAVLGVRAINKKDESSSLGCIDNACPPQGKSVRQDAVAAGNGATLAFAAGGVLLAGGIALYVLAPKLAGGHGTQVQVGGVGQSGTGLLIAGSF